MQTNETPGLSHNKYQRKTATFFTHVTDITNGGAYFNA
jgi:hypothetical protein